MESKMFLRSGLEKLNISYDEEVIDNLLKYKNLLLEWNKKINLTTITQDEEIFIKHFFDSATCLKTELIKNDSKVIDVGTGAGFPGVVLKILKKEIDITLLDSLKKRTFYLEDLVSKLDLKGTDIIHGRAEELANKKEYREKYHIALSRAVASLNVLLEYCLPFVEVGGYFLCQKGPKYESELKESEKALEVLGGKVLDIKEYLLPNSDIKHYILIVEKVSKTPAKYPRKPGKPSLNPII